MQPYPLGANGLHACIIVAFGNLGFPLVHSIEFQTYITEMNPHLGYKPMSFQCPCCSSSKILFHRTALKFAAFVGALGGAGRGASSALAGSKIGAKIGSIAGPLGITIGTVSGAILGGLAGGVGGCVIGAQLGEKLDRHVLANNVCLICGHRFNLPT